ncbi:MAG: hypothetical protein JJE16_10575 [Nitrospiraceae bacterium]|nr:hypothetical protein [Nitrospiraceae bacterium]
MTHHLYRWALLGLVGLSSTTMGCSRWIDVMPSSALQQEPITRSILNEERVPLVMDGFRMMQNGAPQNPSTEIEHRILNRVQETRLFSTLVPLGGTVTSLGDKVVTARISFDETIDPHSGAAAWKGFLIGASMFLLSPAIELNYDYAAKATLELERWDGQVKRYETSAAGTAHYNLFGATPIMIGELKGQVAEACLTELMDQLVRDTTFYMASSSPLPDSPVLTVTVKTRNPLLSPASHSIVPVSTAPAP